jgi:hypothetical protein
MALNIVANIPYLRKLVCAYTGKPVKVHAVSDGQHDPLYFSSDAFDPGTFVNSSEKLFKMLGTRMGVEGAASGGAELTCPYTGNRMTISHTPGIGFRAVGGFRPASPMKHPADFARAMMSEMGKVPADAPEASVTRVAASRREDNSEEAPPPIISMDDARGMAEDILKPSHVAATRIQVPAGAPRKRGVSMKRK